MSQREKVLIISPQVPEFDKYAGWARLCQMIEMLARRYEVCFFAEHKHSGYTGKPDKYTSFLQERGVRLFIEECPLKEILLKNRFKLALIEFYETAERTLAIIRECEPDLSVVLDTVDVHFLREDTKAQLTGAMKDREQADRVKARELEVCRDVEAIFTVTEMDRQTLLREDLDLIIEVIPTIHTAMFEESRLPQRQKSNLLFIGGFNHSPNIDAVRYLCSEILPLVREKHPEVQALIIGDSPPPEILALRSDRVKILGHIPDTKPFLLTSYISVAPLRYGAGMKGKIGEALAHGLPVVTTSVGVQGMALKHAEHVMVADSPTEFADCILALMSDQQLYSRLTRSGPEFIRKTCTPELVEKKLVGFIENSSSALRLKRAEHLRRDADRLYFDTYQRYRIAADTVNFVRDGSMKIIDVGGRGDLLKFLPNDFVVTLDRSRRSTTRTSVLGDALMLPFPDKAFDFAVSADGLEHLPPNCTVKFVDELDRIANRGIILGVPFSSSINKEGENLVNRFHELFHGAEHLGPICHSHHKVSTVEEVQKRMEDVGLSVSTLPNGYVRQWIIMTAIYAFLKGITDSGRLLRSLSEFYSRYCYKEDNREPCCRYVLVGTRQGSPPRIEQLYPESAATGVNIGDELQKASGVLLHLEGLRLLRQNEQLLHETQMLLKEREIFIKNILSRWPYRVFRQLKDMFRRR